MKADKITAMDVIWYGGRRECIQGFKELIKNALKEAREDGYREEDVEGRAFEIIKDIVENM
jgi:Zn-dependent M16 (insulinase) family peptidase